MTGTVQFVFSSFLHLYNQYCCQEGMEGRSVAEVEPSICFCTSQMCAAHPKWCQAEGNVNPSAVLGLKEGWRIRALLLSCFAIRTSTDRIFMLECSRGVQSSPLRVRRMGVHKGRICWCWDFFLFSSLMKVLLITSLLHGSAEGGDGFRPVPTLRAGISIWRWKNFSTGGEGHVDKHFLGTHLPVFLVEFQYGRMAVFSFSGAGRENQFLEKWTSNLLVADRSAAAGPSLLWDTASALALLPCLGLATCWVTKPHCVLSSAVRQGKGWLSSQHAPVPQTCRGLVDTASPEALTCSLLEQALGTLSKNFPCPALAFPTAI